MSQVQKINTNIVDKYYHSSNKFFQEALEDKISDTVDLINKKERILLIGNGGSHVGVCMHFEEDCTKLARIPCLTLSNPGFITCLGNDCGFENIYVEWLKCHYKSTDLVIAVSSSGESEDIIRAMEYLVKNHYGADIVTLSGFKKNNLLSEYGSINIHVPFENYGIVESIHGMFLHMVLDSLILIQKEKQKAKQEQKQTKEQIQKQIEEIHQCLRLIGQYLRPINTGENK